MASLLIHALKGAHAEVLEEGRLLGRLRRAGKLTGAFASELTTAVALTPLGLRAMRIKSTLPVAGSAAADSAAQGVVLHPGHAYGPGPRQLMDIYVPAEVYQQTRQQQQAPVQLPAAPVVFFCHGGIWATGERWHFGAMAARLAQSGVVVAVISYTLYPDALASEMAGEVLAALVWTLQHVAGFGGDPDRLTVAGHSAGGHLAALAVMMLAQRRQQALAAARQQLRRQQQQWWAQQQQQPSQQRQQQQLQPHQQADDLLLSLPKPRLFIGMASIYDVGLHFHFESARGVAGISTMARACGGAALFDAVSPAVILRRAAAAAVVVPSPPAAGCCCRGGGGCRQRSAPMLASAAAAGQQAAPTAADTAQQQQHRDQQQQQQSWPPEVLLGEIIPIRSGMEQPATGAGAAAAAAPSSSAAATAAPGMPLAPGLFGDAARELSGFSLEAAAQLPPFVLMSSCGDAMVPWHEAAEMAVALQRCGVPAKQLIYDRVLHNDFVLDWTTLGKSPTAAAASDPGGSSDGSSGGVARSTVSAAAAASPVGDAGVDVSGLPACARDLLLIVTGRAQLRFSSSGADALAAVVAAMEAAAGEEPQRRRLYGRGIAGFGAAVPLPTARL